MSKQQQHSRLCPFKKIIEREYSGKTGITTTNERFAPCAKERCMAHYQVGSREMCRRLESRK